MTEAEELREIIREAHQATKDLRAALRDAREYEARLGEETVRARLEAAVEAGLRGYENALETAIATGTQAAFTRFDQLTAIMLGEDRQSLREGREPIPELLRRMPLEGRQAMAARFRKAEGRKAEGT